MKEKIKNQKGFIPIPILIGAILLISVSVIATVEIVKHKEEIKSVLNNIPSVLFKSEQETAEELIVVKEIPAENEEKSTSLQVSTDFLANRIVYLHCLQIKGTPEELIALYDVPVYEPNIEGSGVFINSSGDILTNAHVVGIASLCLVQMAGAPNYSVPSPRYFAVVSNIDSNNDLARLRLTRHVLENKSLPSSFSYFERLNQEIELGDKIYVVGFSVASNKRLAITEGIISGRDDLSGYIPGVYLITSAKVDAGNSGGAAITPDGKLIGLPTYLMGKYETLGYVVDLLRVSIP